MNSTRIQMHTAASAACPVVLPTVLLLGTGVPAVAGFRTGTDVVGVDAPPPRGAPV